MSQEARLQVILTKVTEAVALLKALKEDNPDIEDEIAAIENKLAEVGQSPTPSVPGQPDSGGDNPPTGG